MTSQSNHEKQVEACMEFFKSNEIWRKLLEGFRGKYQSYGRFSGTVVLRNLSSDDINELEGFFGKNYHGKASVSVSVARFSQALEDSRFGDVSLRELMDGFFGEPLVGKAELRDRRDNQIIEAEEEFRRKFSATPAVSVLGDLGAVVEASLKISVKKCSEEALNLWKSKLWLGGIIYNSLPYRSGQKLYLPVFAAEITGNPHSFDVSGENGKFLYQIIQLDLRQRGIEVKTTESFPAYKRQKSFLLAGILIDDISNYALLFNVRGMKKDGTFHRGMDGFCQEKSIVQVPLNVLSEWKQIDCVNNELYVVENPSVFAAICGDISCMCMNGQPKLAGLMVLELVEKSGVTVHYSGDFDPEGLLIAQKLSIFYQGDFNYWHMSPDDYLKCVSNEVLSERRLKMLEKIVDPDLERVLSMMNELKVAGYQEKLFC